MVKETGDEYQTMPDVVKAKLQEIEQGELQVGGFDKGDVAETICDRIASGDYGKDELDTETVEAFGDLVGKLCNQIKDDE
ncbi:hypothetical protein [Halorussus sp. MSC15.2]|uniref:hypothetical protein n=1 Tax=Halorussus sp. MSC15.2 TaxID=2283638 RepID=UPI0013D1A8D9|nr:hypothetical protein [Halorussus sp. MSC15.2]NEU58780.1 hypothetical protein [Halorussus sp. MSC15.2]